MTLEEYAKAQAAQQPEQTGAQPKSCLEREQERIKSACEQAAAVYKTYQENIRKAEALDTDILEGLQRGESLAALFLKAVRAYTLCTGSTLSYTAAEEALQAVYGIALQEAEAAALTADAVRSRLEKLKQAEEAETDSDVRRRIRQAITAHENQLANL